MILSYKLENGRKYHLDELPQIINVAIGDMSFVGPRPDVPAQEYEYSAEDWMKRLSVKPGITGLSQIVVNLTDNRTDIDLYYIDNISLFMDLSILLKTFFKVGSSSGI